MIYCPNCKQSNEDGLNYCRFCGTPLPQPEKQKSDIKPPRPYGWASESSSLHNVVPQDLPPAPPQQVQPIYTPPPAQVHSHSPQPLGFRCPRCGTTAPPQIKSKVSDNGWIVFVVMLIFCFPLFWIGLLMREESRVCSMCMTRLG
jgi:lipopolysaccharide-induced tumor necrosis factor-alpha factor